MDRDTGTGKRGTGEGTLGMGSGERMVMLGRDRDTGNRHWKGTRTLGMDAGTGKWTLALGMGTGTGQGHWEGLRGPVGSPLGAGRGGQRLQEQQQLMNNPLVSSNQEPANTWGVKDDRGGRLGSQGCNSSLEIPSPLDFIFFFSLSAGYRFVVFSLLLSTEEINKASCDGQSIPWI